MINILSLDDITTVSHESIPVGLKENKFFVFDNTDNIRRHRENKKNWFWDDVGEWLQKHCYVFVYHYRKTH